MHPWTKTLHRNMMTRTPEKPRTKPLAPRAKRIMGWFTDVQLKKLRDEYLAQPGGPGFLAREMLGKIEHELAERKLDPKGDATKKN